jgi:flagellar motor switch protein FliN/FliY
MQEVDTTRRSPFAEFARRFAAGGDDLPAPVAEVSRASLDAIVRRAESGALFARTSWTEAGSEHTGSLLWIGAGRGSATELDRFLRRRVEAGGDDELGLRWSALVPVEAGAMLDTLQQAAVPATCEVREFRLGPMAFLFLPAAPEPALPEALASDEEPATKLDHLLDVRLPLTIRLGSTRMNLDDVLRLTVGSIVELDQLEDEPLDVLANGRVVARGEVVVVDERFGLRITHIGP